MEDFSNVRPIRCTVDGKDYVLEATTATIKQMENKYGVKFSELGEKLTGAEVLFKGLFIAHHANVPESKRMEIYRALSAYAEGDEPEYDENGEIVDKLMTAVGLQYEKAIYNMRRCQGNVAWTME